tara:strand:+ start:200 stop:1306 length:1107 start_codon:yes stop_codon:yes gene_type:complete
MCLFLILISYISALANAEEGVLESAKSPELGSFLEKKTSLSLVARQFDEANIDRASLVGPHFNFSGALFLADQQSFVFDVVGIQEFGTSQSRFGENVPSNGIFANEAYFQWLRKRWTVEAGVINQGWLENELLFENQPFPAIKMQYDWRKEEDKRLSLFAQLAMPTSTRIKTRTTANQKEPTSMVLGSEYFRNKAEYKGKMKFYYYSLNNLPSEVAVESSVFGNSVTIPSASTARFDEEFQGFAFVFDLELFQEDLVWLLALKTLQNTTTESGYGFGQVVKLGARYKFYKREVTTNFVYFFNESDTSVASYNSYKYGHNNRLGYGLEAKLRYQENVDILLEVLSSDTINDSLVQNEITFLNFATKWTF